MKKLVVAVVACAFGLGASLLAGGALAHQSGCHSQHSCPSDHHTYVWYDGNGQGWSCAEPGAPEYDPSLDTTTIVYAGLTYYCRAAGSAAPSPTTTTATYTPPTTTTTQPPPAEPLDPPLDTRLDPAAPCKYRSQFSLPDSSCTPGTVFRTATKAQICRSGYSRSVRNVSSTTKARVYASYGVRFHQPGEYEVDHLIPLELGGSNSTKNLWPEPSAQADSRGFHQKDALENVLHARVCDGRMTLKKAQRAIRGNWMPAYHAYAE
jgi:hypothetical protein